MCGNVILFIIWNDFLNFFFLERGIENILRKNTNDYNDDDEFKRLCEEKDIRIAELEKMILDLQRYIGISFAKVLLLFQLTKN